MTANDSSSPATGADRRTAGQEDRGSHEDERTARAAGREPEERLPPHREGQTTPQRDQQRVDQQPHERDESSSSQQGGPSPVMRQAHDDTQRGLADTSRAEATDATYGRELRGHAPADGGADAGTPAGEASARDASGSTAARDGPRSIGTPEPAHGDGERTAVQERRPAPPRER